MKVQDNRSALAQGAEIGVYKVQKLMAEDRLSLAYRAWNHHLNAPVFLREYFPSGLARRCADGIRIEPASKVGRKRFKRGLSVFLSEANRIAEIQHKAVNKVLNALEFNDSGYQIMDFEKSQKLIAWIESAYSFKAEQLQLIFEALLGGLKEVHELGLVHGRICPENIILRDNGYPVLIDFPGGLLDFVRDQGTLSELLPEGYASAEQYQPGHQPNPADDIYALGATLYHCVTGKVPLSATERLSALRNGNPDLMAQSFSGSVADGGSPWTKAVDWMLQIKTKDRPHSVTQIEDYLADLAREQQISQQSSTFAQLRSRWSQKLSVRTGLATAAVLVLVVIVIAMLPRQHTQVSNGVAKVQADNQSDQTVEERLQSVGNEPILVVPQSDQLPLEHSVVSDQSLFESSRKTSEIVTRDRSEAASDRGNTRIDSSAAAVNGFPEATSSEQIIEGNEKLVLLESTTPVSGNERRVLAGSEKISEAESKASAIAEHLLAAEKNLTVFNLTTPEEDNAYLNYQAVLDLDPDNAEARAGIQQIEERYAWLIEKAIDKGHLRNARVYLARTKQLPGDSSDLAVLRTKLEKAR